MRRGSTGWWILGGAYPNEWTPRPLEPGRARRTLLSLFSRLATLAKERTTTDQANDETTGAFHAGRSPFQRQRVSAGSGFCKWQLSPVKCCYIPGFINYAYNPPQQQTAVEGAAKLCW